MKDKYSKQAKLLDTEQLECKKLEEENEKLKEEIKKLKKNQKEVLDSPGPEWEEE